MRCQSATAPVSRYAAGMRLRFAWAVGAATFFCALPALANGRFPASNQFLFSPANPDVIWMRTTYGILPSTNNGATWAYICEDVMGLISQGGSGYEDPSVGLMANGNVIAADSQGMNLSTDLGCSWSCVGGAVAGQTFVDLAVFPSDASKAVAMASNTVLDVDSSTSNFATQVFQTSDNGATWSPVGPPLDPSVTVQTLDVPKSDPTRIYVSGTRSFGSNKTAWLFMYTAATQQWAEQPITAFDNTMEDSIYIAAVDPNNADLVYLRSQGQATGGESRLFVTNNASSDAGAMFTTPTSGTFQTPAATGSTIIGELLGFALSPDGSKVYVGTRESGVWMAPASTLVFQQTNSHIHTQCLATRGTELWACSDAVSGFVAGTSTDDGATFTTKLCSVTGMTGVEVCPNADASGPFGCAATGNTAQVCPPVLATICELDGTDFMCVPCGDDGGAEESEGGAVTGGSGADGGGSKAASSSKSSCGVTAVGDVQGTAGAVGGLLVTGLTLSRRRGRRARQARR
jgi:hypothetical protein